MPISLVILKGKKHFATPEIGEIEILDSQNWVFDELNEINIFFAKYVVFSFLVILRINFFYFHHTLCKLQALLNFSITVLQGQKVSTHHVKSVKSNLLTNIILQELLWHFSCLTQIWSLISAA